MPAQSKPSSPLSLGCSLCSLWSTPWSLSAGVTLSYLGLYTAYSKAESRLVPSQLLDLVLLRRGLDWTLVELNKAISLSGLTLMLLSFLPQGDSGLDLLSFSAEQNKELLWISMNMLWGHSVYSFYKFYQFSPAKVLSDKAIKRLSVLLGTAGQVALSLGYYGQISPSALVASATTLSIAHFWTMEVDYKYVLQVRPYAYLPFPLAGWALFKNFFAKK